MIYLVGRPYEPEDPVDCHECGGLFDLRFWDRKGYMLNCPECGWWRYEADVAAELDEEDES